mgnify:CR=1 FL=1
MPFEKTEIVFAYVFPTIIVSVIFISSTLVHSQSCPFNASSTSAQLIEADSGEVIYSQNPSQRIQPASLSKIMTLFLIFDAVERGDISLTDEVVVSPNAAQKKGSTMYLREGEKTKLIDLIKGIAIVSGNDACVASAERLYGSEQAFVDRMNQKLQELNIGNTKFQTVDGWPAADQYTTAFDIAILSKAYIETHPQALVYHKMKEFTHADIVLHNRNQLIFQDPSVDGLKTGHVEEAGYHLIATSKRGDQRYIAVIMGAESKEDREIEAAQLLEYGFGYFVTLKLFDKDDILYQLSVLNGEKAEVGLVPSEVGVIKVPMSQKDGIHFSIDTVAHQKAPILQNQILGKVLILYGREVLKTVQLIANEEIRQKEPQNSQLVEREEQPKDEVTERNELKTTFNNLLKSLFNRQYIVILVISIAFLLIVSLVVYIIKLRTQIMHIQTADPQIVKKRLQRMLK